MEEKMKNKKIVAIGVIVAVIALAIVIISSKKEYRYTGMADQLKIDATIYDYKIVRYIDSKATDVKNNVTEKKAIVTKKEFDNIKKTEELLKENEEGYCYLKKDELVKYLNLLAHNRDIYTTTNPLTQEKVSEVSRKVADDYFETAYKEFEFKVPAEYVKAYVKKYSHGKIDEMTNEQAINVLKASVDMKYTDVNAGKKYIRYIDMTRNSDDSLVIKYYGVMKKMYENSFTQKNVATKLDGTTETTILMYDADSGEWKLESSVE